MGVSVSGMDEWLDDLKTLPERAAKEFRQVTSKAGLNIKTDWRHRWTTMSHRHIPHLVPRSIGYDLSEDGMTFSVEVGVAEANLQAFLAEIITYGTLTSGPHDAGTPALETEAPKMAAAAEKVAADLLDGRL